MMSAPMMSALTTASNGTSTTDRQSTPATPGDALRTLRPWGRRRPAGIAAASAPTLGPRGLGCPSLMSLPP